MKRTPWRRPDVAMIVGAEVELLDVIKAVLMEEAHFHVITETVPERVLPLVETSAPGVVVVDICLPGQVYWDILSTLRQHPHFHLLPVLLLSAVDEDVARVASLHDPWVELLLKPFDLDTVLQRVHYLARQQEGTVRAIQKKADTVERTSLPPTSPRLLLGKMGK